MSHFRRARNWSLVNPANKPALPVAEVRRWLRHPPDPDEDLAFTIAAAVDDYERQTNRCILNQNWQADFCGWSYCLELPRGPVSAILAVHYYEPDNSSPVPLPVVDYSLVRGPDGRAQIFFADNYNFPDLEPNRVDPVYVTFTAGSGESWKTVPELEQTAVRYLVTAYFDFRAPATGGNVMSIVPYTHKRLIEKLSIYGAALKHPL